MELTTAPEPVSQSTSRSIEKPERLVSLDVFRGLTVAGMILVTNPGTYSAVYWPLLHAVWNGWTLTDMIFPSFLFIVGVAMTLSFASRRARGETRARLAMHLVRRALLLIAIGLFLNAFPFFDLRTLRIPGVLQRIALCYAGGGLLYLSLMPVRDLDQEQATRRRVGILSAVIVVLAGGYWLLLRYFPVPGFGPDRLDSFGNLGAYIDRAVFTTRHMWPYGTTPGIGVTFDPEGLLSTFPATANLLVGLLAGELLRTKYTPARRAALFALAGIILFGTGLALDPLMPINKKVWTSTFVMLSSGFSLLAFALCYWIVDIRRWRWWTTPALIFGTNAIFAFALTNIITPLAQAIAIHRGAQSVELHIWLYQGLFLSWLSPVRASLAYALAVVSLNMALVWILYRKRIFLRL